MAFTLPALPYPADALEPSIDKMTMEIHHGRHHKAYVDNLNKALEVDPEYDDAMAYLNLLIRERADLADSPDQYKEQIKVADDWVQKALETKKKKAARQPGAVGITQETK